MILVNNKILNTVGSKIQDIASSVANSKWAESIIPSVQELNQTMVKNISSSKKFLDKQAQLGAKEALVKIGNIPKEEAEKISKTVSSKNLDKSIEDLRDTVSKKISEDKNIDNVLNAVKKRAEKTMSKEPDLESVLQTMNPIEKYASYPKAYFTNPDKKVRNTRIGTAIGTYTALSVGGRYLQGGTLTTDQYGRKDIAGIPFL